MCHAQILNDALRTARKPHRCDECGRTIQPGRDYRVTASVLDDEFQSQKLCASCAVGVELMQQESNGDACYTEGDGREHLRFEAESLGWRGLRASLRKGIAVLRARLRPAPASVSVQQQGKGETSDG